MVPLPLLPDSFGLFTNVIIYTSGFQDDTPVDETSPYVVADFAERLWAYQTIKDLLLQSRITMSESKREEFQAKALNMSLHYRFVTPLTSLVIIQPDDDSVLPPSGRSNDDGKDNFEDNLSRSHPGRY